MSRLAAASTTNDDGDGRRWHIPPPVLGLTGFTGPEGAVILEEVEGPLGALLWRTFRTVATWAAAPAAGRAELLRDGGDADWLRAIDGARPPAELAKPLSLLAGVRTHAPPVEAEVGAAVQAIGRWATAAGHGRTGAELHQLAASVCPDDAEAALAAGRAVRDLPDYPRAEVWFLRAVGLARRCEDWETYTRTFLASGNMMRRRGNMPAAKQHFERAVRRAKRHGFGALLALGLHDLFVVAAERGNLDEAESRAVEALRVYPDGHPLLPWLIHDMAYLWIKKDNFQPALAVFQALKPILESERKPSLLGALALAAGGAGDRQSFDGACVQLLEMSSGAGLSEALLEAAQGAFYLERWEQAEELARHSIRLAAEREEHRIAFLAEGTLEQIRERGDSKGRTAMPEQPYPAIIPLVMERIRRQGAGVADAIGAR